MSLIKKSESEKMYERFKKVSKDITDHYKKPTDKGGYTDDDNKAVEELIENMEKLNELLSKYDSKTASGKGDGGKSGSGGGPKSFRGFIESIFGISR